MSVNESPGVEYPTKEWEFVISGFGGRFSLEYKSDHKVQIKSPNLEIGVRTGIDLWNKVMKEVKLKRYTGPYKDIPEEFRDDYI